MISSHYKALLHQLHRLNSKLGLAITSRINNLFPVPVFSKRKREKKNWRREKKKPIHKSAFPTGQHQEAFSLESIGIVRRLQNGKRYGVLGQAFPADITR